MSTNERKTLTLRNYYSRTIQIDADADPVPIRIRRFTPDQLLVFQQGWQLIESPESERVIYRKEGEDGVPMAEVRRRRLAEMTPDERKAFDALEAHEAQRTMEFCCEQIRQHVSIDSSVRLVVEDEQGDPHTISTGAQIVDMFAGNKAVLHELVAVIAYENVLSAQQKKTSRARSDSSSSSTPPATLPGDAPAATAVPAAPSDLSLETAPSASSADVSAPSAPTPSSVTA